RYRTISGKAYRPRQLELGPWRFPALGLGIAYLILGAIPPFCILGWGSLLPVYPPPSAGPIPKLSPAGYTPIIQNVTALEALRNTILVVIVATAAVLAITATASWIIVRGRIRGKSLLDVLTFLPHTLPSVVIGLAIALVYLFLPIPIYGTIWIIVV